MPAPPGTSAPTAAFVREKQNYVSRNYVNLTAAELALADPNPATAFNPFGDGSFTNPATLQAIRDGL